MQFVKEFTKAAFAKAGLEVHRRSTPVAQVYRPGLNAFVDQQKLFSGRSPEVLLDVGAHHGQTTTRYRELFPHARIYSFEPFPACLEKVRERFVDDPLVTPVKLAASDRNGEAAFFSNRADYTNSLLASDDAAVPWVPRETTANLGKIMVTTTTLDTFCAQRKIQRIDLLKTDVQGAEMKLLRGARGLLAERRVDVLYLEVLFAPLYDGQTNFCDLVNYLGSTGYRLVGIYNIHRGNNGFAGWGDGLFVREEFPIPAPFRERHVLAKF